VAQTAELPALTRDGAGSTPAGATPEGLPSARYPVSKTGGPRALGVRLPLLPLRSGVVESARRATVTRERQVRILPPEPHAPVVETAMTPGPQPGSCGFESRRGCSSSGCGGAWPPRRLRAPEIAGSSPAGQACAVGERLSSRAS